ncbi:MAG TPA: hypothetical protein VFD71_20090 [Planctomycetota bacterium]|nr:hypothetical protein [Planctomycetota bacterium]
MDVEDYLTRFGVVQPPDPLRSRVLAACLGARRSRLRRWMAASAAAVLLLCGLANIAIEARLSAALPRPSAQPPASPQLHVAPVTLFPSGALAARSGAPSPQSFIRLRLEHARSSS